MSDYNNSEPNTEIVDYLFEQSKKYNDKLKLTQEDVDNKVRVMCKEPYAKSLMQKYRDAGLLDGEIKSKDLSEGVIYRVKPVVVNLDDKYMICEDVESKTPVHVSLQEYPGDLSELAGGSADEFGVMITKQMRGMYYGSNKAYRSVNNKSVLIDKYNSGEPVEVTVKNHVRGGYMAVYDDTVECFVPGSHAAANVVLDFKSMIGKTLPVVIDNYDRHGDLFVASHKKYIEQTMPEKIRDLRFGEAYKGVLTSKPTKFGIFVEIENYYTGLVHKAEFPNYESICKSYKVGDEIEVYVRDVNSKNGKYRIVLTVDEEKVNDKKKTFQEIKDNLVGKKLEYFYDQDSDKFYIIMEDGEMRNLDLNIKDVLSNMNGRDHVEITDVDVISESVSFNFCE